MFVIDRDLSHDVCLDLSVARNFIKETMSVRLMVVALTFCKKRLDRVRPRQHLAPNDSG